MKKEIKQEWVDDFVGGGAIPKKETFTYEETKQLVQTALCWAGLQIDHAVDEITHEDVPQYVAECEFKNAEQAITDYEQYIEEELLGTRDFITEWVK